MIVTATKRYHTSPGLCRAPILPLPPCRAQGSFCHHPHMLRRLVSECRCSYSRVDQPSYRGGPHHCAVCVTVHAPLWWWPAISCIVWRRRRGGVSLHAPARSTFVRRRSWPKYVRRTYHVSRVMCDVSRVMCHVTRITCHVTRITCHVSRGSVTCHGHVAM